MTRQPDQTSYETVDDDPFADGWLDRHIDAVVAQIATRPPTLRPQLTGPRAQAMRGFDWNKYLPSSGSSPTSA